MTSATTSTTTTTTSTTTTPSSAAYCYIGDTDYFGDDLTNDGLIKNIANAHSCQERCVQNKECKYWTFMDPSIDHEWAGNCWLKYGQGTIKADTQFTSGPKYCSGEYQQNSSKILA